MILPALFFLTALSYAMVGFGGGSTYLALLAMTGMSTTEIPQVALLCNIMVVTTGTIHYLHAGLLPWRRVWPLVLGSVPMAYVGGRIPISRDLFLVLLGGSLLMAGVRLFLSGRELSGAPRTPSHPAWGAAMGAVLGFFSGLVGIGGGIFLAPILYFLRWGGSREIAATCSFFILVNSISGLAGQFAKGVMVDLPTILPLIAAVAVGGYLGSHLCVRRLPSLIIQRLTAVFVLGVALRILWRI